MANATTKKDNSFNNMHMTRKQITPYLFILPAFIAIASLFIYPLSYGVFISFFDTNLINRWDFVGLGNYLNFLTDADFLNSLGITVAFCVFVVGLHFIIGTTFALILNRKMRGTVIFRTILILPWVFPEVVTSLIFKWILNPIYGLLNHFLLDVGLIAEEMSWLGNEDTAFWTVVFVCAWKGFPMIMVNVLASLQSVPQDIYEAAKVDGANKVQTFLRITVPSIKPVLATIIILDTIWWFKHYTIISLLTQGGPNNSTAVLSVEIYKQAFTYFEFGSAAAMSVVVFLICLLISKVFRRILEDDN